METNNQPIETPVVASRPPRYLWIVVASQVAAVLAVYVMIHAGAGVVMVSSVEIAVDVAIFVFGLAGVVILVRYLRADQE